MMPIRADLRHHYRGAKWRATQARILERAGYRCEHCSKPHTEWIFVTRDGTGRWNSNLPPKLYGPLITSGQWSFLASELLLQIKTSKRRKAALHSWKSDWYQPGPTTQSRWADPPEQGRIYLVRRALTIAHVNHQAGDDRAENLLALCEYCHFHFDREHHHNTRAERKDAARPLIRLAVSDQRLLDEVLNA